MSKISRMFSGLKPGSKKKTPSTPEDDMEIGLPTKVKHEIHVDFDAETGQFSGLPGPWGMWLQTSNIRYLHANCM